MPWKAKIIGIDPILTPYLSAPEENVKYEITVEFFKSEAPTTVYTRLRRVSFNVTLQQILAVIKAELADLNSGDILPTVVSSHLNEEIDENTVW